MSSSTTSVAGGSADPDVAEGQIVGEYQVEAKIGQGGFGTVYRATHPLIGKVVAIKVLGRRFSVDPDMVARFVAEARAVNQIRHRNIIDIFSFGQLEDGRHYYMMEYLDGEPLDQRLDSHGKLALAEALPILRAVARALDAAHAKGIAHRDLKPENVFLARDAEGAAYPKLLDFGIAKLMGPEDGLKTKTRTGIPMGTPYYMSPEQCRGRDVDHRTDFYAFGVMAYQVLTGVFPIDGEDFMTILMAQLTVTAPPASSHSPELPTGVDDALAWLMRRDPPTARRTSWPRSTRSSRPRSPSACRCRRGAPGVRHPVGPLRSGRGVRTPTALAAVAPVTIAPPRARRRVPWIAGVVAAGVLAAGAIVVVRRSPPVVEPAAVAPAHVQVPVVTPPVVTPPIGIRHHHHHHHHSRSRAR